MGKYILTLILLSGCAISLSVKWGPSRSQADALKEDQSKVPEESSDTPPILDSDDKIKHEKAE